MDSYYVTKINVTKKSHLPDLAKKLHLNYVTFNSSYLAPLYKCRETEQL